MNKVDNLNVFKLHTYEASIASALSSQLSAKEVSNRVYRYTRYCLQCDLHPEVVISNLLEINLYNAINQLIYSIKYNFKEEV